LFQDVQQRPEIHNSPLKINKLCVPFNPVRCNQSTPKEDMDIMRRIFMNTMPCTINPSKTTRQFLTRLIGLSLISFGALGAQGAASEPSDSKAHLDTVAAAKAEAVLIDPALFKTELFEWNDIARNRAVPARLYLPTGAQNAGTLPLVVFSHGIGGSRDGYSYLGRHFAAQGYASLHVQHVGSDRQLIWRGNPLTLVGRLTDAAQEAEALNRVKDVKFALDQLLAEPQGSAIDTKRIVAAGHSYGANTTMLLVGARVEVNGGPISVKDPRFSAAILISAPPFYGLGDPQKIMAGIDVPTLHITAMADDIQIPGYSSGVADRLALYEATGQATQAAKVLAVFKGGSHSIFTDRKNTGGVALNPKVKLATRQLAVAFLNGLQTKEAQTLQQWLGKNESLLARFEQTLH
jgi:dienelactone hydrolase